MDLERAGAVPEAPESDAPDHILVFSRRNGIETLAVHWGLLLALAGALVSLNWVGTLTVTPLLIVAAAVQTTCAVVVTVLVGSAVRRRHTYDQTDSCGYETR